jgi:hypothetical protein
VNFRFELERHHGAYEGGLDNAESDADSEALSSGSDGFDLIGSDVEGCDGPGQALQFHCAPPARRRLPPTRSLPPARLGAA